MTNSGLPIIGLSCEMKSPDPKRSFSRAKEILVLNRDYAGAIEKSGGMPFPIPFLEINEMLSDLVGMLDGLVLTGGCDVIAPGADWRGDKACQKRSHHEVALLELAQKAKLPVLGICRGLQQINVFYGGTLWPDLPAWKKGAVDHRRGKKDRTFRHEVILAPESRLAQAIGQTAIEVNSSHHQAARDLGNGLAVVAHAEDGVIEALEGNGDQVIWAVQWHPERLGLHPAGSGLLERFMSICKGP
jgi:putative glutamine amidotransferase